MMKRNKQVEDKTLTVIRERLEFDASIAVLRWRKAPTIHIKAGYRAGRRHVNGHIEVRVENVPYMAHHIIWFLHYGEWPQKSIVHVNGNKADNRIQNLALKK